MKKALISAIILVGFLVSCGPKPYSETSIGKKKWKYYNKTQYGLPAKKEF